MKPSWGLAPLHAISSRLPSIRWWSTGCLEIRDHPPDYFQRTPGPKAILSYLHRNQDLLARGLRLPRSTRTSLSNARRGTVVVLHLAVAERTSRWSAQVRRTRWQLYFKDAASVPPEPDGKQQHIVETLDMVDASTSLQLAVPNVVGALAARRLAPRGCCRDPDVPPEPCARGCNICCGAANNSHRRFGQTDPRQGGKGWHTFCQEQTLPRWRVINWCGESSLGLLRERAAPAELCRTA